MLAQIASSVEKHPETLSIIDLSSICLRIIQVYKMNHLIMTGIALDIVTSYFVLDYLLHNHGSCWAVNWYHNIRRPQFCTQQADEHINMSCPVLKYKIQLSYEQFATQNGHVPLVSTLICLDYYILHTFYRYFCLSHCDVIRSVVMSKTFVTRLAEHCPAQ